jgi:hypothetical protein
MRIFENKALLLRLRNPEKVTSVIPKSKVVDKDVAVHWGLDEAKVSTNRLLTKRRQPAFLL